MALKETGVEGPLAGGFGCRDYRAHLAGQAAKLYSRATGTWADVTVTGFDLLYNKHMVQFGDGTQAPVNYEEQVLYTPEGTRCVRCSVCICHTSVPSQPQPAFNGAFSAVSRPKTSVRTFLLLLPSKHLPAPFPLTSRAITGPPAGMDVPNEDSEPETDVEDMVATAVATKQPPSKRGRGRPKTGERARRSSPATGRKRKNPAESESGAFFCWFLAAPFKLHLDSERKLQAAA